MFKRRELKDDVIMENINEENNDDNTTTDEHVNEQDVTAEETFDHDVDSTVIDEPVYEAAPQDVSFEDETLFDEQQPDPAFNYAPPAAPPPQVEDRLVRDPHTAFAGVLSGIAHRYGFDVSLTRLVFVALTFITAGTTIPIYLLSWIIIPRARFWPPMQRARTRSLSGRDVGFALIGLAVFVALAIGTGEAAAVIVPLGLIIGGVWLLVQAPRNEMAFAGTPSGGATATAPSSAQPAAQAPFTTPQMPNIAPEPVEPRSRKRKFAIFGAIAAFVLLPVLFVGGLIIAAIAGDWNVDIDFDETTLVTPTGVDGIPTNVFQDAGEYVLDLRNTDLSPLDEPGAEPLEVAIEMDAGRIEVLLPAGVDVQIDADVDAFGDVSVFDSNDDGFGPGLRATSDDPQLILDLDLDVGAIEVSRS